MSLNKDVQRIFHEWTIYSKIVIAVDFDDTIYPWKYSTQKKCDKIINLLKWCKVTGCYIMIHTTSNHDRYSEIEKYCKKKGLKIDSINSNPKELDLPYGNEGKPFYNWQLCDRSGLDYATKVLEKACEKMLNFKNKSSNYTDNI